MAMRGLACALCLLLGACHWIMPLDTQPSAPPGPADGPALDVGRPDGREDTTVPPDTALESPMVCTDGTPAGMCSASGLPRLCRPGGGELVFDCAKCPCPAGTCNPNNTCTLTVLSEADTWVNTYQSQGVTYGQDTLLQVGKFGSDEYRAYLGFPLPLAVAEQAAIESAELTFVVQGWSGSGAATFPLTVKLVVAPWDENAVSFSTAPKVAPTAATATPTIQLLAPVTVDVKSVLVLCDGKQNRWHGLELGCDPQTCNGKMFYLRSRENPSPPNLTVTYK